MKTATADTYKLIPKEEVLGLEFPAEDILNSKEDIAERRIELERALSLGNLDHIKVRIVFSDNKGRKAVETTVWGLTDKRVILKGGAVIPIHRVQSIT